MLKPFVIPVIHHLDRATSLHQCKTAIHAGADGVMLISHTGRDDELLKVAAEAQRASPLFPVGVNLLSMKASEGAPLAKKANLSWFWADNMGVSSRGLDQMGVAMHRFALDHPEMTLFASVAFKYQRHEPDPVEAARQARMAGFVPTTSGLGTGQAPSLEKIQSMGAKGPLAIASGMTPENIWDFAPHATHILVATGISLTEHLIDPDRLEALVTNAHRAALNWTDPYSCMADIMSSSHVGRVMGLTRDQLIELFKAEQPDPDEFRKVVQCSITKTKKMIAQVHSSGVAPFRSVRSESWKH